jgi:DNA polymerase/3'-5' exonuclease PolX
MSVKPKIPLGVAWPIAQRIRDHYAPHCEAIELAGSMRRREREVGDIEFVCIPRVPLDLLGQPAGRTDLDVALAADVAAGRLGPPILNGARQKRFALVNRGGLTLELYCVDPTRWGVALAIRTGPALFSQALVTERCRGGLLPDGYAVYDQRVWAQARRNAAGEVLEVSAALPTPREEDVFKVIAGRWIDPWKRNVKTLAELRARLHGREVARCT